MISFNGKSGDPQSEMVAMPDAGPLLSAATRLEMSAEQSAFWFPRFTQSEAAIDRKRDIHPKEEITSIMSMAQFLGSVHALAALRSCRMDRTTKDAAFVASKTHCEISKFRFLRASRICLILSTACPVGGEPAMTKACQPGTFPVKLNQRLRKWQFC